QRPTSNPSPGGTSQTTSWRRSHETRIRDGHVQVRDQADLVSGLRRLRGPPGVADRDPRVATRAVEPPHRVRDRLLEQPAALPVDVRIPCDPRPGPPRGGGREAGEPGASG